MRCCLLRLQSPSLLLLSLCFLLFFLSLHLLHERVEFRRHLLIDRLTRRSARRAQLQLLRQSIVRQSHLLQSMAQLVLNLLDLDNTCTEQVEKRERAERKGVSDESVCNDTDWMRRWLGRSFA